MNSRQPDLCVGIDFGTTCTGVSWNAPKEKGNRNSIIRQWPGEPGHESKVPAILAKDVSGGETKWGFLCKELDEDKKWRFFKLLLDPELHKTELTRAERSSRVPGTMGQVHQIVTLYLRQVYTHLSNEIPRLVKADPNLSQQLKLKTWDSLAIDFIFSTPTTWQAPVSQCFRDIVSKAGFGKQKRHRAMLGLTEAEASAVFTCQLGTVGNVQKGDVVLSIDAGGGTADLAFVKATADTTNSLTLEEIRPVTGINTGSTRIDNEFAKLIEERIKQHSGARLKLPKDFSLKISQSHDFQTWKHKLGPMDGDRFGDKFSIEDTGLERSYSHEGLGIHEGCLYFTRRQLESCFDITLQEIKGLIKESLDHFENNNRRKGIVRHVNHVVLSGGLGSSDYALKELTTYFNNLANEASSCVTGSQVFRAEGDARTVVVQGLLYDRRAQARALREHKARANYGVIVEEELSRSAPSENTKQYPADTTVFATDQIRWLVKFGDTIEVGRPITFDITKRLEKSDPRAWTEKIVWVGGERRPLPETVEDGREREMEELRSVDVEVHKGTKLSSGARTSWGRTAYHKCGFKLMLFVGPSGDCDAEVSENVIKRRE